jgi:hypothetical protein
VQSGYPAGTFETSMAVIETTYEENGIRLRQRMRVGTQRQVKPINSMNHGAQPSQHSAPGSHFRDLR